MQSPISFLVELVLDCNLPEEAKKRCRKYIRELSGTTDQASVYTQKRITKPMALNPAAVVQAASTQRILDEMELEGNSAPVPLAKPVAVQRVIGGEVQTGNGTKGPRKW